MLQRLVLPLSPSIDDDTLDSSIEKLADLIESQEGFEAGYWGRRLENLDVVEVFFLWNSLSTFRSFLLSPKKIQFTTLTSTISVDPSVHIAYVSPIHPEAVLTSPVVEVLNFNYLTSDRHLDSVRLPNFRRLLGECKGWKGDAVGPGIDMATEWEANNEFDRGDRGKSWVILGGWESVQAHRAFQASEAFKERPGVDGKVESCHVVFKRRGGSILTANVRNTQ